MRRRRVIASALVVLGAMSVQASTASAAKVPGLDRSFGAGGVLTIGQLIPGKYSYAPVEGMAAAPGGASYVLQSGSQGCGGEFCSRPLFLIRFRADGALDQAFNGPFGGAILTTSSEVDPLLRVDAKGRPIVALRRGGELTLQRYGLDGQLDQGFGAGGRVVLECGCSEFVSSEIGFGVATEPDGRIVVEAGAELSGPQYGVGRTSLWIERLREDGSPDPSFGTNGVARLRISKSPTPNVAVAASGAIYLKGSRLCCKAPSIYLLRVSAGGNLDTRFDRTVALTLRRAAGRFGFAYNAGMTLRPHGRIDLFGSADVEHGTVLRLRPNGTVQPRFGRGGVRELPFRLAGVALDEAGGTFGTAESEEDEARLLRLLPSDRVDVRFGGRDGFEVPRSVGDTGLAVEVQRGNRAMVLDSGRHACRSNCAPSPKLLRYFGPGAEQRR